MTMIACTTPIRESFEEMIATEEPAADVPMSEALNLNIALGNAQRTITYNQPEPLELPSGSIISQGMLKPTWAYIQDELGITLNDVTIQDQTANDMIHASAVTGFDNATVYGGSEIGEELMSYGTQGYFIRISDNLDLMPNFAAYLEKNPNIKAAITAYDGGIYHIPYVAEIGNYARIFNGRETWITALLDSDNILEEETLTLEPQYSASWDRHDTNIITLQNEVASGELSTEVARNTLLAYIADTYPDYANPSDLYLNDTAQYDIDELIALWRVVKLSPNTLSKMTTGAIVEGTEIYPFFARQTSHREEVLRLITYLVGQRVHGSDSYSARFYLDEGGELQFSYGEETFLEGVDKLADIYSEGLIYSGFADLDTKDNVRKSLYLSLIHI